MRALASTSVDVGTALAEVERKLDEALRWISHPLFRTILCEATAGGKRVRPLLTCLSCEVAGGNALDAAGPAAAVELLHVASLLHDDIMDRSELRRGRPTVVAAHGIPAAVLAGDVLLASAFRLVQGGNSPREAEICGILIRSFGELCEGQSYDLLPVGGEGLHGERHRKTVAQKTARLLEAAASLGAICAGVGERDVHAIGAFGFNLGMAYQAQDDLLDLLGSEAEVGKSLGIDERNGRTTFLSMAYSRTDPVVAIRAEILSYTEEACRALDAFPASDAQRTLRELALGLIERKA